MTLDHKLNTQPNCLSCGKLLDGAMATDDQGGTPEPGAITVCIYCGHLMAFTRDMMLRELNTLEAHYIAGDKRILQVQQARAELAKKGLI